MLSAARGPHRVNPRMPDRRRTSPFLVACLAIALTGAAAPAQDPIVPDPPSPAAETAPPAVDPASEEGDPWPTLGLVRTRDMTPFGLNRLDMLPAHSVVGAVGTWALEVNTTYQNTWVMSRNVEDLLRADGIERRRIGPEQVDAILALPGDAYLVDGEFGLVDLVVHYRLAGHLGIYAQLPWYNFQGGFLDATIESFHSAAGLSNGGRELGRRNDFLIVASLDGTDYLLTTPPSSDFGDPVFGVRWTAFSRPGRWNVVAEAAAKVVVGDAERLVSTGSNDYGTQISLQRHFRRNALYLSVAQVWVSSPERAFADDAWIPTAVAGWETRLTRRLNLILQTYWSRSTIRDTPLDELSADKLQATLGVQWLHRGTALRIAITENLANFDNTPDVGVSVSLARIFDRAGTDR